MLLFGGLRPLGPRLSSSREGGLKRLLESAHAGGGGWNIASARAAVALDGHALQSIPRALLDAGVACLVHPGGSKRDADTEALCRDRNATLLISGVRHFRH